jgi:hypothetical protein
MARPPSDYRYFIEFLRRQPTAPPVSLSSFRGAAIAGAVILAIGPGILLGAIVGAAVAGPTAAILLSLAGGALAGILAGVVTSRKIRPPNSALESLLRQRAEDRAPFLQLALAGHLALKVDPAMLQLLEAAAYHHARIQAILSKGDWGSHRKAIKDEATTAADEGMADLIALSRPCIGEPGNGTDEMNLDWFDSIQRLSGSGSGDFGPRGRARTPLGEMIGRAVGAVAQAVAPAPHQSVHTPSNFPPAREIAERIKALADELDAMPSAAGSLADPSSASALKLDNLIGELKAYREAERELEDRR